MITIYQLRRKWLADLILADAERFDMNNFIVAKDQLGRICHESDNMTMSRERFDKCGTAACLCGTAIINSPELQEELGFRESKDPSSPFMLSKNTDNDQRVAKWLGVDPDCFYVGWWIDDDEKDRYREAASNGDHKAMARIAIGMMERMATDNKESNG